MKKPRQALAQSMIVSEVTLAFSLRFFTATAMTSNRDNLGGTGHIHGPLRTFITLSPAFGYDDAPGYFNGWITPTMTPLIC